jgi:hypothetical protein
MLSSGVVKTPMDCSGIRLNGYSTSIKPGKGEKLYMSSRDHCGEWHDHSLGYIRSSVVTKEGPVKHTCWTMMNGSTYYYVEVIVEDLK